MKVLITGANGQVGWELQRTTPPGYKLFPLTHGDLDITNADAVMETIDQIHPEVIINAAAYTAVDKAEQERDLAYAVNAQGAANIAQASVSVGARLIHISTDFVFDGNKSSPYLPYDEANPINVYGASKLEGEMHVSKITKDQAMIIRTAWVYSSHGNNFVKTILRLLNECDNLRIVSDQIGTPTWAHGLARLIWASITKCLVRVYHWTDAGVASWYDFAIAIQEEAFSRGLLKSIVPIYPIQTGDYPTPAHRPTYSVLEKSTTWLAIDQTGIHWREALREMLVEFK